MDFLVEVVSMSVFLIAGYITRMLIEVTDSKVAQSTAYRKGFKAGYDNGVCESDYVKKEVIKKWKR